MLNATFDHPSFGAFPRLGCLGLEVTGYCIESDRTVLACHMASDYRWCRHCGCQGVLHDTVIRCPAHEPYGWGSHDLAREGWPLTLPDVYSRVASGYESRGQSARKALARGGERGTDWAGHPSSDGGEHRQGPVGVTEHR